MKIVSLGTQIRQITLVTVLIGFVSYAFNFVVARLLLPDDAARVMTSWTVINLCLLIVQFPLELYGPRLLRTMSERQRATHFDSLVLIYTAATAILTASFYVFYYLIRYNTHFVEIGVFVLLIVSSSIFQMFRTINIARENLAQLVRSAVFLSTSAFFGFLLIFLFDIHLVEGPLLATIFGFTFAALFNFHRIDIAATKIKAIVQHSGPYRDVFSFKEVAALSLSNLVSLILVPGGAIFTGVVGLTTEETVVYLGSIALALIPITVLNSTTMPVYLRAINLHSEKNLQQFKFLFIKTAASYFLLGLGIVVSFSIIGEKLLLSFIGNKYDYSQTVFIWSAVAVCASFVGSIPRVFLMAIGKTTQTYKPLILTVCLYVGLVLSVRNGYVGLFSSSISGSVFISFATLFLLRKNIHSMASVAS